LILRRIYRKIDIGETNMKTAPISDLRNYNTVINEVHEGSPVYLTKNGKVIYAIVDAEEYQFEKAREHLFEELRKAELEYERTGIAYSTDEIKERLGL